MKRVVLVVLVVTGSLVVLAQTPDSIANKLIAMDETAFIGKPLDSIIAYLPAGYDQLKIISGGHQYTARYLRLRYPGKVYIELHVREFQFMNPVDRNRVWNINLMRKEKLFKTVIYKHTDCYRNCDVW